MLRLNAGRRGLARVDVLVLLTAAMLLAGVAAPAVLQAQGNKDREKTLSNLSNIGLACHTYADAYKKVPPGVGKVGVKEGTYLFHLLPFVEERNLWESGKTDPAVAIYLSPLDPSADTKQLNDKGVTNFAGNAKVFPKGGTGLGFPRQAFGTSGASNVVMVTTVVRKVDDKSGHCWGAMEDKYVPLMTNFEPPTSGVKGSEHAYQRAAMLDGKAAMVCMGDRSVRSVAEQNAAKGTWGIMTNPVANVPIPENWGD